jgi:hypothetical protein
MRLRKLDLAPNQEGLQVLLRRLAMKRDDLPKASALGGELFRGIEVRGGFVGPLTGPARGGRRQAAS